MATISPSNPSFCSTAIACPTIALLGVHDVSTLTVIQFDIVRIEWIIKVRFIAQRIRTLGIMVIKPLGTLDARLEFIVD
jgi:hypothetical protein